MSSIKTATAKFTGGMKFEVTSGSGHTLIADTADPEEGGENAGFSPMELPLMGLLTCMGMDVVSILRKKRQDLTGYEMRARGVRAEEHPQVFVEITVEHIFTGRHLDPKAVDRAMELSETKYCSVSGMLSKTAQITHTRTIQEA